MRFSKLLTETFVSGTRTDAGLWIEPGSKATGLIKKLAPAAMAQIAKWNWEMDCKAASHYWQELLEKEGVNADYVEGNFVVDSDLYNSGDYDEDWQEDVATTHAWLLIDGRIFDPTAGQFSSESRIWPVPLSKIRREFYVV